MKVDLSLLKIVGMMGVFFSLVTIAEADTGTCMTDISWVELRSSPGHDQPELVVAGYMSERCWQPKADSRETWMIIKDSQLKNGPMVKACYQAALAALNSPKGKVGFYIEADRGGKGRGVYHDHFVMDSPTRCILKRLDR